MPVQDLIDRSHRLGADPRNTNYAGGNTSVKGAQTDPVTNGDVELLWVKGSGGDLGTLTEAGLAVLVATAPGHVATVRERVFDQLTRAQVRQLHEICRRIGAHLGNC